MSVAGRPPARAARAALTVLLLIPTLLVLRALFAP